MPEIPIRFKDRFQKRLESAAVDSLFVASFIIALCLVAEAISQADVGRKIFFWLPLAMAAGHVILFVSILRGVFRPTKSVGLILLLSIACPFVLSTMALQKTDGEHVAVFMALELLTVAVLIPFRKTCLIGCSIIAISIFCALSFGSGNDLAEVTTFLLPTVGLGAFAFFGRQRSIRRAFLSEVEAEDALYELRLAKMAIDNSSHFVVRFNEAGVVEYANESFCAAMCYSYDQLVGRRIFEIAPDQTADCWDVFVDDLIRKGSDRREMRLRTGRGDDILVEVQFDYFECDFHSANQNVICGLAFDLTERRLMEEEIQRVEKLEGLATLAGGVAHDYNNLLVPIVTNAQVLLRGMDKNDSNRRTCLNDILSASERAASLTQQLMVYTGVANVESEPIAVVEEMKSITQLMRSSMPAGTKLLLVAPDEIPLVLGESTQLQRVILNLVINAGQSIVQSTGEVKIQIGVRDLDQTNASLLDPPMRREAGEYVICSVTDTGTGMTAEVQRRMFDPFFTSKPEGRGLGLSAVLGIMRNHKGGVSVRSTPGVGTTIDIYLPALPDEVGLRKNEESTSGSGSVIVVADDDELVRSTVKKILTTSGFAVHAVDTGDAAIQICTEKSSDIDVVILDNRMPGPGLVKIVEAIRKLNDGIRIIVSSGYSNEIPKEILLDSDKVELLDKPYEIEELLAVVAEPVSNT